MYARDFPEASKEGPEAFDKMKGAPAYLKNGPAAFAHLQSQKATEKEFYFWWYQNNVDTRFPTAWKAIEDRIAHLPSFMPRIELGQRIANVALPLLCLPSRGYFVYFVAHQALGTGKVTWGTG